MKRREGPEGVDIARLFDGLEEPVLAPAAVRASLEDELYLRTAPRRGEAELPEGWALCPFESFCIAELRLPRVVRSDCPCLHVPALLAVIGRHGVRAIHARPCAGLRLRAEAAARRG